MKHIGTTVLSLDQFEAMRLCDMEGMEQEKAGESMGISRGTVQRLLYGARKEVIRAMIQNNAIIINLRRSEDCHVSMHTNQRQNWARRHRQ